MAGKLIITLKRGLAGKDKHAKAVCKSLGLQKTNSKAEHADTPAIRGMIARVSHLVEVQEA